MSGTQDQTAQLSAWQAFSKAYFNPQALALAFLGFAAGIPILLVFSSLGLWLREAGIDRATVTMFSWAALGYSFKFIWAPLVDALPLPVLTRWLGRRRGWLLLTQILIIAALVLMAMTNPQGSDAMLSVMAAGAVLLGFSSASQDIVIDAYRIEAAPADMQPALSATYVAGYRIGMIVSGAGALYLADYFGSAMDAYNYAAWQKTYLIMAAVMLIGVVTTLVIREPKVAIKPMTSETTDYLRLVIVFILSVLGFIFTYRIVGGMLPETEGVLAGFLYGCVQFISSIIAFAVVGWLLVKVGIVAQAVAMKTWVEPVADFFARYGKKAMLLLALIGLYRISDVIAGNISNIFYQDLGFSKTQIANAVKLVGVVASIGGGFIGGWLAQKMNIMKAMTVGAILACATNLLFILLFMTPTVPMMYTAVVVDNLAAGLASAVFIAFLSALTSIRFTAVQYALFSSLMTLAPKLIGGYSGAIVDATSYAFFFGFTFLVGIPVLLLIYLVNKHIDIEQPKIGE
ncbi:MFS transporter [Moraxella sp. FZFQ2102]|uniref:AmpG family muropeptide MFS transporter n=1 Tax=Moraxella sp. FZFQ2102 TaxID=2953752 RepID=UPI00209BC998|nr:MFS transporter [Moraxella sp. FZFQ2102]USZ14943.1 MFS transporter [Moraxella sp. FZFQ2102]